MRLNAAVSFLAFVLPASVCFGSIALAENVGEATRVQRYAYQTPPQAGAKAPIFRLDPVVKNARLETVPTGALEVTFTDGSRLTLGSASSVVVDNYVFGGAQGTAGQTLKMTKGLFRFVSGSMPKDQVKLKTPSVTIGIRGTTVKIKIGDDNKETIFFEHGEGFIEDGKGKQRRWAKATWSRSNPTARSATPENKDWSAGDEAVDFGVKPFGQRNHGPDGGTGGGDGAGSQGGDDGATEPIGLRRAYAWLRALASRWHRNALLKAQKTCC